LEHVLHQVGCISKDNHQLIHKINWSRSSRTDKGVHAARLVISAKLLLPPNYPEGIKDLLSLINQKLPEDIRLFSLTKVNQGFCARKSCNWRSVRLFPSSVGDAPYLFREYEYHLPLEALVQESFLDNSQPQTLEMIDKLNAALKLMEGSQG
jgi:tRNA pseudouridine(38-40) synthase